MFVNLFTSELVSEGFLDRLVYKISVETLDTILVQAPTLRVVAMTLVNTGLVVLVGRITTANVDYIKVALDTIKRVYYENAKMSLIFQGMRSIRSLFRRVVL